MTTSKLIDLDLDAIGTEIVTIYVGPKRKAFSIHKKLLCSQSEYFDKAFNGIFAESKEVMYLPEDDPDVFDAVVGYIYRNRLPSFPSEKFQDSIYGCTGYIRALTNLVCFSEKICMNVLAKKSMDAIQNLEQKHCFVPDTRWLGSIYRNTNVNSKLRLYHVASCAVDLKIYCRRITQKRKEAAIKIPEFGADFLEFISQYGGRIFGKAAFNPRNREGEEGLGKCFFHTHSPGEVCHLKAGSSFT